MVKIFESPDKGATVYERIAGERERTLIRENKALHDQLKEDAMWGEIRRMGKVNPVMQEELERVIILYHLLKAEQNGQATHI
jgi:hypothetical protein